MLQVTKKFPWHHHMGPAGSAWERTIPLCCIQVPGAYFDSMLCGQKYWATYILHLELLVRGISSRFWSMFEGIFWTFIIQRSICEVRCWCWSWPTFSSLDHHTGCDLNPTEYLQLGWGHSLCGRIMFFKTRLIHSFMTHPCTVVLEGKKPSPQTVPTTLEAEDCSRFKDFPSADTHPQKNNPTALFNPAIKRHDPILLYISSTDM